MTDGRWKEAIDGSDRKHTYGIMLPEESQDERLLRRVENSNVETQDE